MLSRSAKRRRRAVRDRSLRLEVLESRQMLASIQLAPVADNTLYESATGELSNGAGEHLFVGRTNQPALRRGLLRFDVGSEIPSGSTINSVSLQLHASRSLASSDTIALHQVLASWGEGTSKAPGEEGTGTAATDGDATWLHRMFDNSQWSQAGGDFEVAASASTLVDGIGDHVWSSAQMVEDVQDWLGNPATQFGWLLKGNESASGVIHRFDSRENPTPAFRPVLTIDFTAPSVNMPPSDITLDNASVAENTDTASPVVVGTLAAIDPDAGDSHSFTLVTGSGDTDNASFQVTGTRLQFQAGVTLDHEAQSTYAVRVRATDSGGLTFEKSFVISVTDVNEAPTDILLSRSIIANRTPGATVGRLEAVDPEQADTHAYTVSDDRFEVVGDILKLKDGIAVDSDTEPTLSIEITATDSGNPPASAAKGFTLTVTRSSAPFQNPINANDVNGDGFVSPLDALILINYLNEGNKILPDNLEDPPRFLDVNGDDHASPIDALIVINVLNDASSSGEGESGLPRFGNDLGNIVSHRTEFDGENNFPVMLRKTFVDRQLGISLYSCPLICLPYWALLGSVENAVFT